MFVVSLRGAENVAEICFFVSGENTNFLFRQCVPVKSFGLIYARNAFVVLKSFACSCMHSNFRASL